MSLTSGTRIGVYEVTALLGEGGMGAVYRARDTKLNREVALKVLLPAVADDPERLARFSREAQVLASLNHPHIAGIYGLEDAGATKALVMELVEGEDLSQRIARHSTGAHGVPSKIEGCGAIPLDEALPIARQIAEALEAAHEQGIVHRDLKPANIKVRPDGTVKVLDFGLAKAMEAPGSGLQAAGQAVTQSPTITSPAMTQAGMILGTAAYMAPEQAKGRVVDRRADIWAFGAVLYEMLTGQRAFPGDDVTDTIVAVLSREPDWTCLRSDLPRQVRVLLERCLQKDLRKRLPHIGVARQELESPSPSEAPRAVEPPRRGRWALVGAAVAGLATGMAAVAAFTWGQPVSRPPAMVSTIEVPELIGPGGASFAISPDAQRIVFVAPDATGRTMLWVRPMASLEAQALAGTEGAAAPFWSPDARHIGFVAGGTLKRLEASGGTPITLAPEASAVSPGTWSRDDVILFVRGREIHRVSARGGTAVTTSAGIYFPHFLPDGQHFLYLRDRNVRLTSLAGGDDAVLIENAGSAAYAAGHLLFMRETTLYAQPFDPDRLTLGGDPVPLAEHVQVNSGSGAGKFSVSESGALVYQATSTAPSRLVWIDRAGREVGEVGEPGRYSSVSLSADETTLAASVWSESGSERDIWLIDTRRGARTRLTSGADDDTDPLLSRDGTTLAYASRLAHVKGLYVRGLKGAPLPQKLAEDGFNKSPNAWSADGRHLLFERMSAATAFDLWLAAPGASTAPAAIIQAPRSELNGEFSPDGRFLAYQSSESGRDEVYLARFPVDAERWPVSTGGGTNPHWSRDGRELLFMSGRSLMRAPVNVTAAEVEIGAATPVFSLGQNPDTGTHTVFTVAADGQRFLFNVPLRSGPTPITLVVNWPALLPR